MELHFSAFEPGAARGARVTRTILAVDWGRAEPSLAHHLLPHNSLSGVGHGIADECRCIKPTYLLSHGFLPSCVNYNAKVHEPAGLGLMSFPGRQAVFEHQATPTLTAGALEQV